MRRRRRRVKLKANPAVRRRRRNPLGRKTVARLARRYKQAGSIVKRSKKGSRRRKVASLQRRRAGLALQIARGRGKPSKLRSAMSPLTRAMSVKANPGLAGVKSAMMVLAPQAAVGAVGLVGLAMAGKKVSEMVASKLPVQVQPYAPALATAGLSVVAYVVADKVAPKYKGAIAIGGMLAAVVQAIVASAASSPTGVAAKAKGALLGEYTTVGSGIFRGVGEYTTVGTGGDNATEWASDSLRGLDDATEFAPGEGGILSGGIFR
jgi:hypothetical protein